MVKATELHCPRDLALRLGAIGPADVAHHKELRDAGGHMMIRDQDGAAMFWPLLAPAGSVVTKSS